jgi:hypothetical protein
MEQHWYPWIIGVARTIFLWFRKQCLKSPERIVCHNEVFISSRKTRFLQNAVLHKASIENCSLEMHWRVWTFSLFKFSRNRISSFWRFSFVNRISCFEGLSFVHWIVLYYILWCLWFVVTDVDHSTTHTCGNTIHTQLRILFIILQKSTQLKIEKWIDLQWLREQQRWQ